MRIIWIVFWGFMAIGTVLGSIYILVNYGVQRYKDKRRSIQGTYIRRVNWPEAILIIFTPGFPCLYFAKYLISDKELSLFYEILGVFLSFIFVIYAWYVHVAYVKISPEGVEQRILSAKPTRYPFNVIDSVYYREALSIDDQDIVGFYTKSGKHIAAFCPIIHGNYRLLAIVRFRIENERWPDMNNLTDVAQVNLLDTWGETIPFFRERGEISGLAEVDM